MTLAQYNALPADERRALVKKAHAMGKLFIICGTGDGELGKPPAITREQMAYDQTRRVEEQAELQMMKDQNNYYE